MTRETWQQIPLIFDQIADLFFSSALSVTQRQEIYLALIEGLYRNGELSQHKVNEIVEIVQEIFSEPDDELVL